MNANRYEYNCVIRRVVDGDTVDVDIDLGFGVWLNNQRIRLCGVDAPETRTRDLVEKLFGYHTTEFVESTLPVNSRQLLISREFQGKYGRILGDFLVYDSRTDSYMNLTAIMLREHLAVEWQDDHHIMMEAHQRNRDALMSKQPSLKNQVDELNQHKSL